MYMMVGSPSGFGGGSELHIHELEAIDAVAATCTKAGNTAYWFCEGCGKYFADEDGIQEIEEGSWVVEPEGHTWKSWKVRAAVLGMKANTEVKVCTKCKHVVRVTTQVVRVDRPVGKLPCRLPVLTFFGQRVELSLEDSQG